MDEITSKEDPSIMLVNPGSSAAVRIQAGEQTTEHALTASHNLQATILQVLAGLISAITGLIDLADWLPQTHTTLRIITIGGIVLVGLKQVCKTVATIRYTDGRSLIKSAAVELLKNKLQFLAIGCLLLATASSPAYAINIAPITAEPKAVDIHNNGNVPANAIHGESNMIHVEPKAVEATATGTINVAEHAIDAKASTTAPLIQTQVTTTPKTFDVEAPITFNGTPNMIHFEIIVPPNAIVVHAEGLTQSATKPLEEIKQGVQGAFNEAKFWLEVGLICAVAIGILVALSIHFYHVARRRTEAK